MNIFSEIETAKISLELSKFTTEQLQTELDLRAIFYLSAHHDLYKNKDTIAYDYDGTPYNTEAV